MSDPVTRHAAEALADETTPQDLEPVASTADDLPPLRDYNVFATFDDPETARDAIVALERTGIDASTISALVLDRSDAVDRRDDDRTATGEHDANTMDVHAADVARGGAIGGVAGALGSAAVALAIPGVGAAIGAGILAVAAGGAMAGTGVGAFAGAVASTPASKGWQQAMADLHDGRVVVGVHSNESQQHHDAMSTLAEAGAVSVRELDHEGEPLI